MKGNEKSLGSRRAHRDASQKLHAREGRKAPMAEQQRNTDGGAKPGTRKKTNTLRGWPSHSLVVVK